MLDVILDALDQEDPGEFEGAVVGIDLGTTNSVVFSVVDGVPTVIGDVHGDELQPSTVAWQPDGSKVVGAEAVQRSTVDPTNTVHSVKRLIGKTFSSRAVEKAIQGLSYRVTEGTRQEILIRTREGDISVPKVSMYVLLRLKKMAERVLNKAVTHCVITVPANFSDSQRAATRQAAGLAGLEVLRILNEPTAAAIAYGEGLKTQRRIAVFDLGGGTFDISVLAVRSKLYEVVATGGDSFLGGDDVDAEIHRWLAEKFLRNYRIDLLTDPVASARLRVIAEKIKRSLSNEERVEGSIRDVAQGPDGKALGMDFSLSRKELEGMIAKFAQLTMDVTDRVLGEAEIQARDLDEVILVGGSTYIPLIRRLVEAKFGKIPRIDLDPMRVVAMGASIHAEHLVNPEVEQSVLLDVIPHSLRVATVSGYSRVLIPKNTAIPAEGMASFFTARDNQGRVTIRVGQGEEERFEDNVPLGELLLDELPRGRRGDVEIAVAFTMDADGMLRASAKDVNSDIATHVSITLFGLQETR